MKFSEWLDENKIRTVLTDASGVLYNDQGLVNNIAKTIAGLQKRGPVVVVTNNSTDSPDIISKRFLQGGLNLEPECIYSSGHGLSWNAELRAQVQGKTVYVMGDEDCYFYFFEAGVKAVIHNPNEAEVWVLMSSLQGRTAAEVMKLTEAFNHNPPQAVICCNPDWYVRGQWPCTLYPVMGYFAQALQGLCWPSHQNYSHFFLQNPWPIVQNAPEPLFFWYGKPFGQFALDLDSQFQKQFKTVLNDQCVFIDDNPFNVATLVNTLGVQGVVVTETGLYRHYKTEFDKAYGGTEVFKRLGYIEALNGDLNFNV